MKKFWIAAALGGLLAGSASATPLTLNYTGTFTSGNAPDGPVGSAYNVQVTLDPAGFAQSSSSTGPNVVSRTYTGSATWSGVINSHAFSWSGNSYLVVEDGTNATHVDHLEVGMNTFAVLWSGAQPDLLSMYYLSDWTTFSGAGADNVAYWGTSPAEGGLFLDNSVGAESFSDNASSVPEPSLNLWKLL